MAKKFTYSRMIVTDAGSETFTASEFDSFDEAQRVVEKGIHDRRLQLDAEKSTRRASTAAPMPHNSSNAPATISTPAPATGSATGPIPSTTAPGA